jgi:hypothetical protein
MGHLGRASCAVYTYTSSAQTSREGIKYTKGKE